MEKKLMAGAFGTKFGFVAYRAVGQGMQDHASSEP